MGEEAEILFIGDSLIEYFDWEERFPGRGVRNLGISGETVEWLLERVPRITAAHPRVRQVFLMTGINNLAMEDRNFLTPYRRVIEELGSAYPECELFVTGLLPTLLPWIPAESIRDMNRSLETLAGETGARYLDVHSRFLEAGVRECLSADGIHLSERGYQVWSETLEDLIAS